MEFKNKKNKGWILEEIEKKTECLESKNFGGEEPEDVEKHQEEVNKEINKRFDGVKKVAQKVVGKDFEEHAKPHKVEVYYVGRKDLGEAIGKLKEQNINYSIKRSPKEGFRYVVEYFSDEHKKDEPLLEKIDLEEEDASEGLISGAPKLSYDELAELEKNLWEKLKAEGIYPENGTFENSSNSLADLDLEILIDGDWKHDHLFAEHLVEEWCKENGYVITRHTSEVTNETNRDDYEAVHHWFLIKDTDGKMSDTVAGFKKMFSKPEEESGFEDADESLKESKEEYTISFNAKKFCNNENEYKELTDKIKDICGMKSHDSWEDDDEVWIKFDANEDEIKKISETTGINAEFLKKSVDESLKEVLDDEELPDAIPDEAIVVSTEPGDDVATVVEEPSEEVKKAGLYNALSAELRDTLQDIENLKSLTVTFVEEGREDLIDDLNAIIDERTIHSGMLQDLMSRVEGKVEAAETNTEPVKEESLKESKITFEVNDDGDLVAKSKDNFLIIGSEEDASISDKEKKDRMMKVLNDFKDDETMKSEYDYWMSLLGESLKEDVAKREYSDEEIERAKKFQALLLKEEGREDEAEETDTEPVKEESLNEEVKPTQSQLKALIKKYFNDGDYGYDMYKVIADKYPTLTAKEVFDAWVDLVDSDGGFKKVFPDKNEKEMKAREMRFISKYFKTKEESLSEDAHKGYARKPYDNLSAEEEQIRHELEWDLGAKEDKMGMTLSHAYDDMMRDYKYVRGNENAMNKLMKAFNISKEDLLRYIDYKQDGLLVPKDGHKTRESLEEDLGDDIEKQLQKYSDDFGYVADAYDDDNKDIMIFATRNKEAKDKVLKELGDKLGLKDAGYDEREKAWCICKRANRGAKESLEEDVEKIPSFTELDAEQRARANERVLNNLIKDVVIRRPVCKMQLEWNGPRNYGVLFYYANGEKQHKDGISFSDCKYILYGKEHDLEEEKEETIHLDKYEIDDKDSKEQKEDAKIMPYGEVTKSQWEDFLSKAKWPYWLAWENLKNEVEHKD